MGTLRVGHKAPLLTHSTPVGVNPQPASPLQLAVPFHLIRVAVLLGAFTVSPAAQGPAPGDLDDTLTRVGSRVLEWYARAQSIVSTESVVIQGLGSDLGRLSFPRRLGYELRITWDGTQAEPGMLPEAHVLRQLVSVNGRPPRERDEPGCMDPKPVSPEPLAMLLPSRRAAHRFSFAGRTRMDGRDALMIDYQGVAPGPAQIEWTDDCVSLTLPGRSRGRVWVDALTYDVLRLDEGLMGLFEFDVPIAQVRRGAARSMTIERADSTIRYKHVQFDDPPETLLLPDSIESFTVVRGGGTQRHRITQRLSNYRRFLTGGRIVQ